MAPNQSQQSLVNLRINPNSRTVGNGRKVSNRIYTVPPTTVKFSQDKLEQTISQALQNLAKKFELETTSASKRTAPRTPIQPQVQTLIFSCPPPTGFWLTSVPTHIQVQYQGMAKFSMPPPPLAKKHIGPNPMCIIDMEGIDLDNVTEKKEFEIGYWFGVPITTRSILKTSSIKDLSKREKTVKFSARNVYYNAKKFPSCDEEEDENEGALPMISKNPERYIYDIIRSPNVYKMINQEYFGTIVVEEKEKTIQKKKTNSKRKKDNKVQNEVSKNNVKVQNKLTKNNYKIQDKLSQIENDDKVQKRTNRKFYCNHKKAKTVTQ